MEQEARVGSQIFIMIDTCVWLDLAKDYRQRATIGALQELINFEIVVLLLPQQVIDEFDRNKDRIIKESGQSLASTFRRVRDAVTQFGRPEGLEAALIQLGDIDHRVGMLGEAVNDSIGRIEKMFAGARKIQTNDATLRAAAMRGVEKRAPFHKPKNSMGDAILIEIYAAALIDEQKDGKNQFVFVTHNKHDFSSGTGDDRIPHPDIADFFNGTHSTYSTNLNSYLNEIAPKWVELQVMNEYQDEPRLLSELLKVEDRLTSQVWYNRHRGRCIEIEESRLKVLPEAQYSRSPYKRDEMLDTIWNGALAAAKRVEEEVGLEDLGPWSDFEWGMINGKLSAIRWMLGYEWDMLDT